MKHQNINVIENGIKVTLNLGRQGEYNVRDIKFDMSDFQQKYGDGTATIVHYPANGSAYTVPSISGDSKDSAILDGGNILTWTIGRLATRYDGKGIAEITWTTLDGLKKSVIYNTYCKEAIGDYGADRAAQQSYIDQMVELASTIADLSVGFSDAERIAAEISDARENAVSDIETLKNGAVSAVNTAKSESIEDIGDSKESALDALNTAKQTTLSDIESAKHDAETDINAAILIAETHANNASQSATNASSSATSASNSADSASQSAASAQTSATNASNSAASASQYADNASSSANSASQSAALARASATNASTSEQNARQSAETAQDVLDSVQAEGNTQINRVQSEGNTQIGRVQAKGNEILNSLPSDFTQVQNDIAALNGSLGEVSEHTRNLWLSNKDVVFTRYTAVEVNLPDGKYTFSAEITSEAEGNFCRVQFNDASNAQLTYVRLDKRIRDIQAFTLTDTCKYIYLYSGADASASTGYEATYSDIMISETQYAYPYIKPVSAVDAVSREGMNSMTDMLGYDKPNLIDKPFTPINNMNGITGTLDKETWEITYNGTATASFGTNIALTLPVGKYYLSGLNGGSSGTFFYRFMYADGTYFDQTKDTVRPNIEITEEQTVRLYIRFVKNAELNNVKISPMIRRESIWSPIYARYGEYAIYKPLRPIVDYSEFNWAGKKMVVLGDSIARGGAGLMTYAIGSILNLASIKNYAIGGSSIASRSEYDATYTPVVTKYLDADTDADIVLVHAGTNDYSSQVPIGDTDFEDITTFNGALNVLMAGLRSRYPTSLIVFSGILDRVNDDLTVPCQVYREALEAACRRHFMVFYNGYKETNLYMKGENNPYTADGLHPNQVGANILGRSIAGFIKWH